ncbi:MAG: hypothetical protein U1E59_21885 [Amaricoccus sp.]
MLATMLRWAVILGAIGFLGGFVGPIILTPDANQGPLLGIFITGPLGFVAGLATGFAVALSRRLADRSEPGRPPRRGG